ncbi:MAG TPA: hypothetical protein DHV14_07530 [Micrococcales bacterium]|uniref:Alpha-E domain-containing protein n=1 Tax=Miniimonas arenae TaxID=676201 RepID=A0A5C5B7F6_9MICO|nr:MULTISPECIES: alpha-E domain-containing protein [Miniimonas]TNU72903.1 alpha-E domain-containing protein [Miniimonas arenae]HCX84970.1 hypothetical protein [Micrococcales bacterium]
MLSRIAESLFWVGRYVERADDTARILDVHLQLLLEDPWISEDLACRSLLAVMGAAPPPVGTLVAPSDVLDVLAYDRLNPGSIAGALEAARENARRARETISTELWECLNTTRNELGSVIGSRSTPEFFAWVRERGAVATGIADSATSRDQIWTFLVLGRSIERADMTARLVATRAVAGTSGPSWTTLLRSCGAYEAFLRAYRGNASDALAAEFLLLDPHFPRSVVYALKQAEDCLLALGEGSDRTGTESAMRILGRVRSGLEFRPVGQLLDNLPEEMEEVQRACSTASDAVGLRYFPSGLHDDWVGERL